MKTEPTPMPAKDAALLAREIVTRIVTNAITSTYVRNLDNRDELPTEEELVDDGLAIALGDEIGCLSEEDDDFRERIDVLWLEDKLAAVLPSEPSTPGSTENDGAQGRTDKDQDDLYAVCANPKCGHMRYEHHLHEGKCQVAYDDFHSKRIHCTCNNFASLKPSEPVSPKPQACEGAWDIGNGRTIPCLLAKGHPNGHRFYPAEVESPLPQPYEGQSFHRPDCPCYYPAGRDDSQVECGRDCQHCKCQSTLPQPEKQYMDDRERVWRKHHEADLDAYLESPLPVQDGQDTLAHHAFQGTVVPHRAVGCDFRYAGYRCNQAPDHDAHKPAPELPVRPQEETKGLDAPIGDTRLKELTTADYAEIEELNQIAHELLRFRRASR